MPFHRISQWTGGFFKDTSLTKIGLEVHLGHAGKPCPGLTDEWCDTDDEGDHLTEGPWIPLINDPRLTTVVDTSGLHSLMIRFCKCTDAMSPDMQLLETSLFPASFTSPKTAFTFAVLDDFLLDNLECGTSAMNYYTCSLIWFQQWRQVKQLKWHGFGHEKQKPKEGELALFCPACPQPGVNLNLSERNESDPVWLYSRSLVMDGNFKAEHLYPTNLTDEVALTDGLGFMSAILETTSARKAREAKVHARRRKAKVIREMETYALENLVDSGWMLPDGWRYRALKRGKARARIRREAREVARMLRVAWESCASLNTAISHHERHESLHRYKMHLSQAQDIVQRSECNNHRAVNQANASRHKLEATGIGGSLGYNTYGIDQAFTFYDINCQYNKHLRKQIEESPYLDLPWGMDIIPGIGLWHVHSHQDKCYVQYASNFITGAARIDSEIMETLWAPLNIISLSARGMSTPHRKECLDFQMNDCNFMKMIRISKFLCRKFKEAVQGVQDSRHAFDRLSETAEDDTLVKWEAEAVAAQDDRLHNPSSMDIYKVRLKKSPTRKQQELHLLNRQAQWPAGEIHHGAATWLACGITLEESQVALLIDVKKLGKRPMDTQKLAIARRRDRLQGQLDEFVRVAVTFLGDELHRCDHLDGMTVMLDTAELDSVGSSCEEPDRPDDEDRYDIPVEFNLETVVIPLPSNISIERCAQWGVADLVLQEISLREGQANDALHAIRVNLADKAILFCTTVWSAKSQARSTRAWARVHSVDKVLHLNAQIYSKCHKQLIHLGADDLLTKYRPLEKADLKATTVVADPNVHGQRNNTLAWFWSIDVEGDSANNDWMNEFYRVHWLRTLTLRDRWAEELLLVGREMIWTVEFFIHKSQQWVGRMQQADATHMVGHSCYAARQAQIYLRLSQHAQNSFDRTKGLVVVSLLLLDWPPSSLHATGTIYLGRQLTKQVLSGTFSGRQMYIHQVVSSYRYDWWKDCFDRLGSELPVLNMHEVMEMTQDHFEQLVADGSNAVTTQIKLARWAMDNSLDHIYTCMQLWASVFNCAAVICNRQCPLHRDPRSAPEGFNVMTSVGHYCGGLMTLSNLGIQLHYNSGAMVACSGHIIRHGITFTGDHIVWTWFMRDSLHNFVGTPRPQYATYMDVY
ncbi:uncharacterized protein HD556DRAFT_1312716 [Suillus plorans]|uniref:CxC2-like cysteine cluster KDZ transposase-associated domain-containing protein n=1 Tax=Suillus plorans TaxID=116603 RepID=A0A9P7AF36_9AGAM|nr:uncharacterized protein HD556DRAFT_1312716 [Suillus plorans]KAG1787530.1 hypothetical protein HD556DRAFT_1312716 [Suillus plorans]